MNLQKYIEGCDRRIYFVNFTKDKSAIHEFLGN